MNGMTQFDFRLLTTGSDSLTAVHDFVLPPTPTLAQISLCEHFEFDDKSHCQAAFTSCEFVDASGVTRAEIFPETSVHAFGRNGLVRATFLLRVSNAVMSALVNFFFWDRIS